MYARDMSLCPSFAVHSHRGVLGRCHLSFCQRCTCTGIFCHQCGEIRTFDATRFYNEDTPEWEERMVALKERAGE